MDRPDRDLNQEFVEPGGVDDVTGMDRLRFARQVLLGLGVICSGVFVAQGMAPDNPGVNQIFELVKIGALPLVTLVVSFYFPNSAK